LVEKVIKRVLLVGAYQRDNLGDLLFLLVTERYLEGTEVVAAAPFSADMREQLGRCIPAYGPLLRSESFDAIWTVGGQVGRVDLARAYKMSASPRAWRRYERRSEAARARILRRAAGGATPPRFEAALRAALKVRMRGSGRRLTLELTSTLRGREFESAGERLRWRPPEALAGVDLDVTELLGSSQVQVFLHSLRDGGEYA
jgi:hypothetical protein